MVSSYQRGRLVRAQRALIVPRTIDRSAAGSRNANAMCAVIESQIPSAIQSWTNVAPVRMEIGNGSNHLRITPVASITTIAAPRNAAFSFWPGLNLPSRA